MKPSSDNKHGFLIAFDSDGCVFDNMEVKHRECFGPAAIHHFCCHAVRDAAREVWDFVNLYGSTRGCNRFTAVKYFRDLLRQHPAAREAGFTPLPLTDLDRWLVSGSTLSQSALTEQLAAGLWPELCVLLRWSEEVNERVEALEAKLAPFPGVSAVIRAAYGRASLMVVSQATVKTLHDEWTAAGLAPAMSHIGGQEHGNKSQQLRHAATLGNFKPDRMLMVGDAPGDLIAARENGAHFFPIMPGRERQSWKRLHDEGLKRFFSRTFGGEYQASLSAEFEQALPALPRWSTAVAS